MFFIYVCFRKDNACCPIDNKKLTYASDVFPDNFTRREILQIRKPCPNTNCLENLSPLEMDHHILECKFRENTIMYDCLFKQCGCKFKCNSQDLLDKHMENDYKRHLQLLMMSINQNQSYTSDMKSLEASRNLWDAPNKSDASKPNSCPNSDLIRSMYERIVVLEQKCREKDLKLEKIQQQLSKTSLINDMQARCSGGILIWRITQFENKIDSMRANSNIMFYSDETYTSPYGYKYCARINIPMKIKDYIGIHIHLMQSENDYHLDWPFRGRIRISMIHKNIAESQHDTIMSKPEILAFHRPTQDISPRGFGFLEYANIQDIIRHGFVLDDVLTIKIQMNIV